MTTRWIAALLLAMGLVGAACGGTDAAAPTTSGSGDMSGMPMGDASLVRADLIAEALVEAGDFARLESAPVGYDAVDGTAWLARHDTGTTVTVELAGLVPNSPHIAHVHAGTCVEAGGAHYQFDPNGGPMPPNEIHLMFTSDADGVGLMTAENARVAGVDARSVVVHPVNAMDAKVACAELG